MSLTDGPVTLLVVDDEEAIRNAVRKYLVQQGYEVAVAATGEEALDDPPAPEDHGHAPRREPAGHQRDRSGPPDHGAGAAVALLMLTAVNDATSAALCMQRGALDYLIKPIDLAHLGRAIARALERRHTLLEGQQVNQWLKEEVALRAAERRHEQATQERISVATLEALVNALEAKDPYLRGHSARVADLSASVAAHLGLPRRGDRGGAHRGPAARHRQDRDPRGGPEQAGPAERRGVRARQAARAGRLPDPGAAGASAGTSSPTCGATTSGGTASATPTAWPARPFRSAPASSARSRSTTPSPPPGPTRKRCPPRKPWSGCATSSARRIDPAIHEALEAVVSRRQALVSWTTRRTR